MPDDRAVLILNADDFGLARCVNRGIVRAHREGPLTSASLLANGPAFDDAAALARAHPGLGVGVHLNLVRGRPLCDARAAPWLVGADGRFDFPAFLRRMRRSPAEGREQARREYAAQIDRVRAAGLAPTHVDSEQHHARRPALAAAAADAARAAGVPARRRLVEPVAWAVRRLGWPGAKAAWRAARLRAYMAFAERGDGLARPDGLLGQAHIGRMAADAWRRLFAAPPAGVYEVMVHPGEHDGAELARLAPDFGASWIHAARPGELAALLDPAVRAAAADVTRRSFSVFAKKG